MTAEKTYFDLEVLCHTKAAIPKRTRNAFVLSDVFSDLIKFGWSDVLDMVAEINPSISLDWQQQPEFVNDAWEGNINFVRFLKSGRVAFGATGEQDAVGEKGDIAGFCLKWREAWLDCKIGTTTLDAGNFDLNWKVFEGDWDTTLPVDGQQHTCVMNSGDSTTARIQTKGNIAANRGLLFNIDCVGVINPAGPVPRVRCVMQKKKYSLLLVHGKKPAVQVPVGSGWSTVRTLKDSPNVDLRQGRYQVSFQRIGGRMVVGLNGNHYHLTDMSKPLKPDAVPDPVESQWPEGPIQINAHNCRIVAGLALLKYANAADVPFTAQFARRVRRTTYLEPGTPLVAHNGAWQSAGTIITVVPVVDTEYVTYTATLTANAAGIDTPLILRVMCLNPANWNDPVYDYKDIRPGVKSCEITMAMPPVQSGAEATLEVDRSVLDKVVPGWRSYVDKYHPVTVAWRWHYDDNSADAWTRVKFYIYSFTKATRAPNDNMMSLRLVDPIQARLKAPAALIDHHYPPLDWFWLEMVEGVENPTENVYYGAQGAKDIINIALGPAEAARFNGNGEPLRFFTDHYPLLSLETNTAGYLTHVLPIVQPPTKTDWLLPAPHGSDAFTWIGQLLEHDHAVCFSGWPDGATGNDWPCIIYGRITNILAGRATITIPDNDYNAGDVNRILKEASIETRPDRDINVFYAWANIPNVDGVNGLLPAIRMAEDRLKGDDPNRPELTWERYLVMKGDLLGLPAVAETAVRLLALEMAFRNMIFPTVTIRGTASIQWGDKVVFDMSGTFSDTYLGLIGTDPITGNAVEFRVERVVHTFTLDQVPNYDTKLSIRPLSTGGF